MRDTSAVLIAAAAAAALAAILAIRRRQSIVAHQVAQKSSPREGVVASVIVSKEDTLSATLCEALPREFPSRAFVKGTLKRNQLLVDGTVVNDDATQLKRGQLIEYVLAKAKRHMAKTGKPPTLELEWAYTDDRMAVCVKPQGVAVQGDESANRLSHAVAWALPPPNERPDALATAQHCHRIDKMTGGLLVYARTKSAAALIGMAFAKHEESGGGADGGSTSGGGNASGASLDVGSVRKTYLAIVAGKLEGSGVIDAPVHGKFARSRWQSLSCVRSAASGWVTTLRLHPETGRQHQLRRHLAVELGCPILGDPKYLTADSRAAELDGALYLWAMEIELPHPATGEPLRVSTVEPPHFQARREAEEAAAAAATSSEWQAAAARAEERKRRGVAGELQLAGPKAKPA